MRLLLVALALLVPGTLSAGESAAFLKIGVGARPVSLGGAYTAIASDINALAWNPAGLGQLTKREVGATHTELFAGTRYDFIGFAQPTQMGTWGMSANYLSQESIEGRDARGKPTGSFSASDKAVTLAFGRPMDRLLRLGGGLKFIQSNIGEASAQSFAVDLGGLYDTRHLTGSNLPLTIGLAVQNIGPGMRFLDEASPLPLTIATGLALRLPVGLTLAADFRHRPNSGKNEFGLGTEYAVMPKVSLRFGYASSAATIGRSASGAQGVQSAFNGLGTGLGLTFRDCRFDYAFTPFGELGNVQRISLGARF